MSAKFQFTQSRGLRHIKQYYRTLVNNFNSRSHVDCDTNYQRIKADLQEFQFTQSRGLRPQDIAQKA